MNILLGANDPQSTLLVDSWLRVTERLIHDCDS